MKSTIAFAIHICATCLVSDTSRYDSEDGSVFERIHIRSFHTQARNWVLSERPLLRLGAAVGDVNQEFSQIRGVVRLSDGRIVVADGGSQQLRYFGPTGTFLFKVGRQGNGPGEFSALWSVARTGGDSILVWDRRSRRISAFTSDGQLAREIPSHMLPAGLTADVLIGQMEDGSLLFGAEVEPGPQKTGVQRSTLTVYLLNRDLTIRQTISVPGREVEVVASNVPGRWITYEIPFARETFAAVGRDRFYIGSNDRFEIQQRGLDGRSNGLIRHRMGDVPLTRADANRLEKETLSELDESEKRRAENIVRLFRDLPLPPLRPAFSKMLVDAEGNLWVAEWVSSFVSANRNPMHWRVFTPDGRLLADARLPSGLQPFEIGNNYVLGVSRDDDGVEYVHVYTLRK